MKIVRWCFILLGAVILWGATTDNVSVWPIRNTIEYHAARAWWNLTGMPDRSRTGSVAGRLLGHRGQPIANGIVLVSEWDGRVHTGYSDVTGSYRINGIPMGFYRIAAGASGFQSEQSCGVLRGVTVRPEGTARQDFSLSPSAKRILPPFERPERVDVMNLSCTSPVPGDAVRETLKFNVSGTEELIFLYRPIAPEDQTFPLLLTVYPGPVDTWECVSVSLAQAGYAVLAIGPAYGLDLTPDVDRLERLISMVKAGSLAGADPDRIAALGGSYSALLLELLLLRDPGIDAVVLLGPPTDLFDFRRRFEREGFVPPFGLDKALIALGMPSRDPLRYLNHSIAFQTRPGFPPLLIFHSYQDEIVPYQQSGLLADSLRKHGSEVELHLFEGASHYLLEDGEASMKIYRQTLNFFRRHAMPPLPGKE